MATIPVDLITDDYTGESLDPSAEPIHRVRWAINGQELVLDLGEASYAAFREAMGPWLDASQPASERDQLQDPFKVEEPIEVEVEAPVEEEVPIELLIVGHPSEAAPHISPEDTRRRKPRSHGYTAINGKLLVAAQRAGAEGLLIRSNLELQRAKLLQRKLSPLGIQLRFEEEFRTVDTQRGTPLTFGRGYAIIPSIS